MISRFYETEEDLQQMRQMLMEARRQSDDWRYAHVGDLAFWFFMVACHLDPQEFIRLWVDSDRLVGYAILGEDPSIDWQILPEYEWCGIEDQVMAWTGAKLVDLRKDDPQRWGGPLKSGARKDNLKRREFLELHGFVGEARFSEVNLICSLDGEIPEPIIPPGYKIREMGTSQEEISNRAGAQRDVWLPWTVGEISDENYTYFMRLPGYDRELDIVAVAPDGVMAATVNGWNDPVNKIGDFGPVGCRPLYRRQGLTRAVLLECMRRMKRRGMDRISVSTNNDPAIRLYESVGFRIVNEYIEYVQEK